MKNLRTPLNNAEMERLDAFLLERIDKDEDTEGKDEGIINISELDGFFTATVSGPGVIQPSQWLSAVWGDFEPVWESTEQFQEVLTLMMRHMNGISATLMEAPEQFEPLFMEREVDGKTYCIADVWCAGYLRGMRLDPDGWGAAAASEEIQVQLGLLLIFSTPEGGERLDEMTPDEIGALQEQITPAVCAIYAYWLERRKPALEQMADIGASLAGRTIRRDGPKVGRNDPCPCGSGRKYKKCCGAGPTIH